MISGAQTKSLNPEKYATHLSDYNKNKPASNNTAVDNKALLSGNLVCTFSEIELLILYFDP